VTLRLVLKTAIRHNWLTHLPDLSPPYRTQGKIVHRPWFSNDFPEEYFWAIGPQALALLHNLIYALMPIEKKDEMKAKSRQN
jgi:hypothetical protein